MLLVTKNEIDRMIINGIVVLYIYFYRSNVVGANIVGWH